MFATKIKTLRTKTHIFYYLFLLLLIISCAKMGSLGGGPIDREGPIVLECIPANGSINFNAHKIEIRFNEYISLKDISNQLIVSPPINPKPEVSVSGKKVVIKLKPESLLPNKTYQLNFGNAIVDVNEGNQLNGFVFSFSTGDHIDSLQVSGTLVDALSLKPVEGAVVSLYNSHEANLFRSELPQYLSITNKDGKFSLNNLAQGSYSIFALKDANYNYYFDQPSEPLAFYDSLIQPGVNIIADSARSVTQYFPTDVRLHLFTEDHKKQYITNVERSEPQYMRLVFNLPNRITPEYSIDNYGDYLSQLSENADTLTIWLLNENDILRDTVSVFVKYYESYRHDSIVYDTLIAVKKTTASLLPFTKSSQKQKELYEPYAIRFSHPIAGIETGKIGLFEDKNYNDSIVFEMQISNNPCVVLLTADIDGGTACRLIAEEGAFTDYYGRSTMTDSIPFTVRRLSDYGSLILILTGSDEPAFAELLQQDKVKYKSLITNNRIEFMNIIAGRYSIRITHDVNNNGYWDTGNLDALQQPEPVFYYTGEYEIRSNWQHELEWAVPFDSGNK